MTGFRISRRFVNSNIIGKLPRGSSKKVGRKRNGEKEEHLEKVRKAYLNLENDSLVRIIDATRTPKKIFDEVWRLVCEVRNG